MKISNSCNRALLALASLASLPVTAQNKALACNSHAQNEAKPNVIIIYADDLGYGDLGCYGEPTIHTPNVERVAREGVVFTNAHSTSSVSTPARFGLLTGIYPWRYPNTGIAPGDAAMIITPDRYTLPDMMKSAGYTTAAIGKWHLGLGDQRGKQNWNGEITPGLKDIGFDYSFIMAATGDRVPCVYIENSKVVDLDPSDPIEVSYNKPFEGIPTGKTNPELVYKMKPSSGHNQAIVNGISRIGYMKGGTSALWRDEDIADRITDAAIRFICQNKDTTFFMYFGTNDIHVPRMPHERFQGKSSMGLRGDAILEFDNTVGRVMKSLDSLGIADNTLLIISSDNGPVIDDGYIDRAAELLGSHRPWGDYRGGKYSIYEAGTRVPFIVRWPNHAKAGVTSNAMVSHIDMLASLAQLTGASIPKGKAIDSKQSLDQFLGKNMRNRSFIVEQGEGKLSITMDNLKYIAPNEKNDVLTNKGRRPQLYDLKNDLHENVNLIDSFPKKAEKMRGKLNEIIMIEPQ